MTPKEFWSEPERVEEFARREPDVRLQRIVTDYADPPATRVLDVGCAGGRNTRYLIERGFDTWALDLSEAMVERTRAAIEPLCGADEARRRVMCRGMEDLSFAGDRSVDLVVALGVLQMAPTEAAFDAVLADLSRILKRPGGKLLVAIFGPGTCFEGVELARVDGTRFVHRTADGQPLCVPTAAQLDEAMAVHGLTPIEPTETVERERKGSRRVVANALYALS